MKKITILSILFFCTFLSTNLLYSAKTTTKIHNTSMQNKGPFIKITQHKKTNPQEKTIHERTQKPLKAKEIEKIEF